MNNDNEERHIPSIHGETEHEWWYQPTGYTASVFGEHRAYWYCNVNDMGGTEGYPCRAISFTEPALTLKRVSWRKHEGGEG